MLNGGGAAEVNPGRAPNPSGASIVAESASACARGNCENTFLFLLHRRADGLEAFGRIVGVRSEVAQQDAGHVAALSASASVRRLTGTIAISGASGSAFCSTRYARSAPAHIASTTSLTVTPAACLDAADTFQ